MIKAIDEGLIKFNKVYSGIKGKTFKVKNPKYKGEVGNFLESQLGIKANNKNESDYKGWEIKTLTKSWEPKNICSLTCSLDQRGAGKLLLEEYGIIDADGMPRLGTVLDCKENELGLKIVFNELNNTIDIYDKGVKTGFYWSYDKIKKNFNNKYEKGLILAYVERSFENFKFAEAFICTGFNDEKFINLIKTGVIKIKIGVDYYKSGKLAGKFHDHGMAFIINEAKLPLLFSKIEAL